LNFVPLCGYKILALTFSFLIEGDTKIVAEKEELLGIDAEVKASDEAQICMISGEKGTAVETTTATMIPGSQATAKLVAFQIGSGYDSYGKTKGENAPISEEAEFAYTTALNHLLAKNSRKKFLIGNRTYLFWASSNSEAAKITEESIFDMFGPQESSDDPNRNIEQVRIRKRKPNQMSLRSIS
jgi:CRISPR-associated protein Csd1